MYFDSKNYLKNKCNHTDKHTFNHICYNSTTGEIIYSWIRDMQWDAQITIYSGIKLTEMWDEGEKVKVLGDGISAGWIRQGGIMFLDVSNLPEEWFFEKFTCISNYCIRVVYLSNGFSPFLVYTNSRAMHQLLLHGVEGHRNCYSHHSRHHIEWCVLPRRWIPEIVSVHQYPHDHTVALLFCNNANIYV